MSTTNINALLVKLSMSIFPNSRQDRQITDEVKLQRALGQGAGKWVKHKLPDECLDPLRKFSTATRQWHYEHTCPWDEGYRIITAAEQSEYNGVMAIKQAAFWGLVDSFGEEYAANIEAARQMHGATFNPSDYPEWSKVRAELFAFSIQFFPVPKGEHFSAPMQTLYGAQLEDHNQKRIEEAVADTWNRLLTPVRHMAEKLAEGDKPCFRDSLVDNIKEIVAIVPKLNLTSDAQLNEAVKLIEGTVAKLDPQMLRDNPVEARSAQARATEIVERFGNYGKRRFA